MNGLLKGLNGSVGAWLFRLGVTAFVGWASWAGQGLVSKLISTLEAHGEWIQAGNRTTGALKDRVDAMDADSKFRFGLTTEHLNKIDGKVDKLDDRLRSVETGGGRR